MLLSQQPKKRTDMIIPVIGIGSLIEYKKHEHSLDQVTRPAVCPSCHCENCFWKHGSYLRRVFDGRSDVDVRINRYLCSRCDLTVSCIFSFLVPYAHFSPEIMANAVQQYAEVETSYVQKASDLSDMESDSAFKPSQAQVFRWVDTVSRKASGLTFALQKEFVMRGQDDQLNAIVHHTCPNV
jgi:hypothetical protein